MIAAIYARKSTEQNGVDDEEKSVTRQIEHAKAYAAKKRWTVGGRAPLHRRRDQRGGVREAPRLPTPHECAEAEARVPDPDHVRGVAAGARAEGHAWRGPGGSADAPKPTGCVSRPANCGSSPTTCGTRFEFAWRGTERCCLGSGPVASWAGPLPSTASPPTFSPGSPDARAAGPLVGRPSSMAQGRPPRAGESPSTAVLSTASAALKCAGTTSSCDRTWWTRWFSGPFGTRSMSGSYTRRSISRSNGCSATTRQTRHGARSWSSSSRRWSSGFSAVSTPFLDGVGVPEELQARLREEKARKQALAEELERLRGRETVVSLDVARLKRDLARRVTDMAALLSRHTAQARQALRPLLVDKIDMEPVIEAGRRGYRLSGRLTYGRLLQGEAARSLEAVGNSHSLVAPTGFEPMFQP
jgi:hypothetical protein